MTGKSYVLLVNDKDNVDINGQNGLGIRNMQVAR